MSLWLNQEMLKVTGSNKKTYSYPRARYSDPNRKDLRRKVENKKGWQVAEMWDTHHEIARRLVLGQRNVDIAREVGVTPTTVANVKNSPVVQDKLSIMRAARDAGTINLAREIADLAPVALERVKEALETGKVMGQELNPGQILREANNLLDREIGKPTQRVDTRNIHGHFTITDIERIKEKAMALAGCEAEEGLFKSPEQP